MARAGQGWRLDDELRLAELDQRASHSHCDGFRCVELVGFFSWLADCEFGVVVLGEREGSPYAGWRVPVCFWRSRSVLQCGLLSELRFLNPPLACLALLSMARPGLEIYIKVCPKNSELTPLPGGSAWPSAWTTNSDYASALSSWQTQTTGAPAPFGAWGPGNDGNKTGGPGGRGPGGWKGGNGAGPFGQGGPGNGWGPWSSASTGDWTAGPWTSWWGGSACPESTWSGWTDGPWGTDAPWTTWSGCEASTTASSVVTTTVTTGSSTGVQTSTSYGIQVAAVTDGDSASASETGSAASEGAAAMPTAMAGSAMAAVGVLGAALLL